MQRLSSVLSTTRARALAIADAIALGLILGFVQIASAADTTTGLQDPLKFGDIYGFVQGALQAFVEISLPILSFFFIWSGFLFVRAQGNSAQLEAAKKNFQYLMIGAVLILSAWALSQLIANTVTQIKG
ncbi:MAG TPA: hypothetical protein VFL98_00045 [Candidatus Paceibacterota bacterium]|nr:hypothetical protein [Candidatus Paceibacterota bacterium]